MSYRIAIVEDDIDQQQNYADSLQRKGFATDCYDNVDSALAGILATPPDLVLLDVVLGDDPDGGFTICRRLLDRGNDIPIVFLTDRSEEIDQVFGLRLGAWDYQTKPISLSLLAERIKNVARIHHARQQQLGGSQAHHACEQLSLDEEKSYVSWHGQTVPLTLTEFRLLSAIVHAGPEGIDYEALCESTMQRMVTNGTINSHIKNIRKKFNQLGPEFHHIRNKPGFGYRWENT
ncbi:MAG: response regulator transcription factor [Oleiphilaceae bacterium]|nr:response regulator transcription factor [Oleiphilaceae bacterium]